MVISRFTDHLPGGAHTALPAPTAVPVGSLFSCTTHNLIYKNDGTAWPTWATLGAGSGGAYPPGSADAPPATANARDDEFNGTSAVTWSATPTAPTATNVNVTRPGHLYVRSAGPAGVYVGRYQSAPATFPYTVLTKVVGDTSRLNFHRGGGIILYPATPTASSGLVYFGKLYDAPNLGGWGTARIHNTAEGTFGSIVRTGFPTAMGSLYLRAVLASATSVTLSYSLDGWAWRDLETYTVPFSVANIGLAITEEGGGGVDSYFDFFRVT